MGFCNCAGNIFRLAIVVGTVIAVILQWTVQYMCEYALNKDDNTVAVGIWKVMVDDQCVDDTYHPEETDPFITAARTMLTLAMVSGFIGGVIVAFEWLLCEVCCAGCITMISYISAMILSGLVNLIYFSEPCTGIGFNDIADTEYEDLADVGNHCEFGKGSTYNAFAVVLYFVCAVLLCWYVYPRKKI